MSEGENALRLCLTPTYPPWEVFNQELGMYALEGCLKKLLI